MHGKKINQLVGAPAQSRPRFDWNVENVALLKKRYAEGASANVLRRELGCATLGMVTGKLDRLGLNRSGKPVDRKKHPRKNKGRRTAPRFAPSVEPGEVMDTGPELIEIPLEQRKTLLQLTEKTCRWPVGDPGSPEFFFCGGVAVNKLPYCNYHARIAYQPPNERRRRRRRR